jgi:tetratricopeptide (TPR) repeat protein
MSALIAMLRQGRPDEAERRARALLASSPDSGALWKITGVALAQQGKDALPALRRAAQLLPEDAEAHRNLGAALHARGLRSEALASLHRVLELEPRDFKVLVLAANTLCTLGQAREAVELYQRALEIEPRSVEAQNNLGNAFQELGDCAQAAGCYRLALAVTPDDPETLCNLSNALRRLGHLEEARDCSQRAIARQPELGLAHNNLGLALAALGARVEAVESFGRAININPRSVDAINNLGNTLRDLGKHREAAALHRTATEIDPQRPDSHFGLGNALYGLGLMAMSEASFRRALELRPQYPAAQLALATALRAQTRAAEAQDCLRALLGAHPDNVAALCLLGDLHADSGEFAEAGKLFERTLELDADFAPAYCSIAAHNRMTENGGAWLRGAERLLGKPLALEHEIGLRYALGKYFDDLGRYDTAFARYREANELCKRHESAFSAARLARYVGRIIERFDLGFVRAAHAGASDSERPVFVVGMPRSGTSLVEQIIASHPQGYGAGELDFWEKAFEIFSGAPLAGSADATAIGSNARDGGSRGADVIERLAREYLERPGARAGAALRVVDKMPANFLHLGLIHAVFPRARIIHMQRDPLDTCLSLYFQNFFHLHPWASDLGDLVQYYQQYLRVTDHWRVVLPEISLLEVPYEALIADQEQWTRRILAFVGLHWDPRCLDFHETRRTVITASRWQVRQKIYAASVGRWRRYEGHIGPLRQLRPAAEA